MNSFTLKIWDDECVKCTFYTVQKEGSKKNETDKFLEKFENTHPEEIQILLELVLDSIGERHGAIDDLLNRHENEVKGLPNKGKKKIINELFHYPEFPLRLYVLKITDNILILFNGGLKDGPTNDTSSVHMQWLEACQFAKKIQKELSGNGIIVNQNRGILEESNGESEIYIY